MIYNKNEKSTVILVKCDSYKPENVNKAINEIFDLAEGGMKFKNSVLIKPNLCLPVNPNSHITTHPEIIRQLVMTLGNNYKITVAETNIGNLNSFRREKVWEKTGLNQVIREFNINKSSLNENISSIKMEVNGVNYTMPISDLIFKNDIINVPKLKTHGLMGLTGCVKNVYGILAGDSKKLFHKRLPNVDNFAEFLCNLYSLAPIKYNIVDAVYCLEGDGPGISGTPRKLGLLIAGDDGFTIDRVLCVLMGIAPSAVPTNYIADFSCDDLSDINVIGEPIEKYIAKDFILPEMTAHRRKMVSKMLSLNKGTIDINHDKCKLCKMCIKNCPNDAIKIEKSKVTISQKDCISCLVCQETCLHGAIRVKTNSIVKEMLHTKLEV